MGLVDGKTMLVIYSKLTARMNMPIQSLHKQLKKTAPSEPTPPLRTRKSLFWWKIGISAFVFLLLFVGLLGYRLIAAVNTTVNGNKRISVFAQLGHLVANRDAQLRGETQDRVNILLLGIGGAGHEGPLLTDTIILASVKPSTGQVALISIPRDLAVAIPGYGVRKINNANAFGKERQYPGGGEQLTVDIVSDITGQPIQYFARIDFAGFEKIINDLGGITLTVEKSFVDREYPTKNFGYQTVRFATGKQQMNGATALIFVRSRHGTNGEGSDFARSHRQQLVLEAIRDKVFSLGTLLNPVKVGTVIGSLGSHTGTNLEVWELLRLGKIIKDVPNRSVISRVLESGPNGPLKNVTGTDGAFLLMPKDGTFEAVKAIARNAFLQSSIDAERARISIQDATGRSGSGKTLAATLVTIGFPEPTVLPPARSPSAATTIVDYSRGRIVATTRGLESYLNVTSITNASALLDARRLPDVLSGSNVNETVSLPPQPEDTDILIILGKDYLDRLTAKKKSSAS